MADEPTTKRTRKRAKRNAEVDAIARCMTMLDALDDGVAQAAVIDALNARYGCKRDANMPINHVRLSQDEPKDPFLGEASS